MARFTGRLLRLALALAVAAPVALSLLIAAWTVARRVSTLMLARYATGKRSSGHMFRSSALRPR